MKSIVKFSLEAAQKHLDKANPTNWNGKGNIPDGFDVRIGTYPISQYDELDISFECIDGTWTHCCEIKDITTGDTVAMSHGDGIDSAEILADTIACLLFENGISLE